MYNKKGKIMWPKFYKDYEKDKPFIKYPIETGKAIKGCEMHEFYGWGTDYHQRHKKKKGRLLSLLNKLFKKRGS